MAKYRQKPVVIEALSYEEVMNAFENDRASIPLSLRSLTKKQGDLILSTEGIYLKTSQGWRVARPNDYIIQGVKGEISVCRSDVFEAIYERVEE